MSKQKTLEHKPLKDSLLKGSLAGQLQESIESIVKSLPKGEHLTAYQVYKRAEELGIKVSLSTVYRTLNNLNSAGNVSTVAGEHGKRYEAREIGDDHDHLICLKCGLTVEFADDLLKGFGKAVAKRKGFDHKSSRFDIFGFCSECKLKREDLKIEKAILLLDDSATNIESLSQNIEQASYAFENGKTQKGLDHIQQTLDNLASTTQALKTILSTFNE
jgi:Fur family ferric uptake transcriptional regulator